MGPKFRIIDSYKNFYDVQNISKEDNHLYSIEDTRGHYAELGYNQTTGIWTETWNRATVPAFIYDLNEVGALIQKALGF
jgi:hypothetical protein